MSQNYYVYIVSSLNNRVLYIGVTSNLSKRVWEHKNKLADGFTKKYNVDRLVYYEIFESASEAIHIEKCMKEWQRRWKIKRIETMNPDWQDLYKTICM